MSGEQYDYEITDHGSIMLLRGLTPECEEWIEERVGGEDRLTWGDSVVVEPRYVADIVTGLHAEGFDGPVPL